MFGMFARAFTPSGMEIETMGKFAVISLTDAAAGRVREIVDSREAARGAWNTRSTS